ncbi:hypothetical protein PO509_23735, partial [Escherichia coli]
AHFRRLLLTQTIPTVSWLPEMRLDVLSHRRNGVEMKLCPDDVCLVVSRGHKHPGLFCATFSGKFKLVMCSLQHVTGQ